MPKHKCIDPYGMEFESELGMAEHYGIEYDKYTYRKGQGWTLEECLGLSKHTCNYGSKVTDPKGVIFNSEKEMAEAYGISYKTYGSRKASNWTLEERLGLKSRNETLKAPNGKEYATETDMAKDYDVMYGTYRSRKEKGWTLRECLGIDKHIEGVKGVIDPNGKWFESESKMAMAYGIGIAMYKARKSRDWTLRECLGIDKHMCKTIIGVYGLKFESEKAMAKRYNVDYAQYSGRKQLGWTIEECLELSGRGLDVKIRNGEILNRLLCVLDMADSKVIRNFVDERWYYRVKVRETGEIKYMNSDQIKAYPEGWKTL